jgi:serine phosphatase RsbU (regulator of sigma subunit)/putative methionine-R-sulfoxide reductase with GAF domain
VSRERLLYLYCVVVGSAGVAGLLFPSFALPGLNEFLIFGGLMLLLEALSFRVPPAEPQSLVGLAIVTAALILGPFPAALIAVVSSMVYGLLTPLLLSRRPDAYLMLARPWLRAGSRTAGLLLGAALAVWFPAGTTATTLIDPVLSIYLIGALFSVTQVLRIGREFIQGGSSGVQVWLRAVWPLALGIELLPLVLAPLWAAIYLRLGPAYFWLASLGLIVATVIARGTVANLQRQRRSVRELGLLNEVSRAIIRSELDSDALCELVYRQAAKIVDTSTFHLGLFDGDLYTLKVRVQDRVRLPAQSFVLVPGEGIIGWMRQTGRALLVDDFEREMDQLPARPRYHSTSPPRAGIYVPLIVGDQVIGSISVQSYQSGAFSASDLRLLSLIADQAAVAIARAHAYSQARQRALQLQAVRDVGIRATAILNLEELLPSVVRLIRERFGYHPVHIFTVEADNQIVFRASTTDDQAQGCAPPRRMRAGEGLVGQAVLQGEAILVGDVQHNPHYISDNPATRAELVVPLKVGDQIIGVLDVQSEVVNHFNDEDLFVMQTLAGQVAIAIDSANSYTAQQEEAWTLNALLQVAENVGRADDLDDLLATVVRLPPLLVGCERCCCLLWEREERRFRIAAAYGFQRCGVTDLIGQNLTEQQAPLLMRLVDEAEPLLLRNAARNAGELAPLIERCRSGTLVLLPIVARNSLLGVLLLDYDRPDLQFNRRQMAIYTSSVSQIASALESALLAREAAAAALIEQELRVAREIQRALLPAAPPRIAGWDIAADWRSARLVGGDFYDFWHLQGLKLPFEPEHIDRQPEAADWLGFTIADVSDKGVPAAMFMALARSLLRAAALNGTAPAAALERANRWINRDSESGMFVTLFYAVLEKSSGRLRYCCAGHNPPLLYRAASGRFEELSTPGIALGVLEEVHLHEAETRLEPGDLLVCYTDGLTETVNEHMEDFGIERLRRLISAGSTQTSGELVHNLVQAVNEFSSGQPPFDDVTLLVIKRGAPGPG